MKRILIGLAVMAAILYVIGVLVMGIWWLGPGVGQAGGDAFWSMGWWPWLFLGAWPAAGVIGLLTVAWWLGDTFLEWK